MNIVICDDEENVRMYVRGLIEKQNTECKITEFSSGREMLEYEKNNCIDVIFLDVEMENMGGIEAAEKLRRKQEENNIAVWGSLPLIIFVTGFSEYMQKAFSVNAFGYIVKPIKEKEFEKLFARAEREYRYLSERNKAKEIIVGKGSYTEKINSEDIYYIESKNHKILICLNDEYKEYYGKISILEKELEPVFFRTHKGYLVNLKYVEKYNHCDIYMKNGDILIISRYKYHNFVKAYLKYISGDL